MTAPRLSIVSLIAVLALTGALAKSDKPMSIRQVMEAGNKKLTDALAAGDAAKAASVYAERAQVFPPGAPLVSGRPAIQTFLQSLGKFRLQLTISEAEQEEGTAWESGTWILNDDTGTKLDNGKYLVLWTQTSDGWKIYKDIWNSDVAPAPAPAPAPAVKK